MRLAPCPRIRHRYIPIPGHRQDRTNESFPLRRGGRDHRPRQGIGAATSQAFAEEGCKLVLAGRDLAAIAPVAQATRTILADAGYSAATVRLRDAERSSPRA